MKVDAESDETTVEVNTKTRAFKLARNIVISILVLFIVLVGGGTAYTWYMGKQPIDDSAAIAKPIEPVSLIPKITPTKPAANSKVGASVQALTSVVAPGKNASMSIKTNAGAICNIKVVYDKTESKDSGLAPKTADEFGILTWTWTVEETAAIGKWPIKMVCTLGKQSAELQVDLEVKKDIE